jgi:hypothetical protein
LGHGHAARRHRPHHGRVTDTIAAINRKQGTFAGTGGKTRTFLVGPNVNLKGVEVGDEVVLEVTRAVAVDIKPA